jgi:hypothetical protein
MESQIQSVVGSLAEHGWLVRERQESMSWWATEVWTLESEWSPRSARAFLTLLVDPMQSGVGRVWAIGASRRPPVDRSQVWAAFLSLGHGWQEDLGPFVAAVDALRSDPTPSP